jgi:hypothetical protein
MSVSFQYCARKKLGGLAIEWNIYRLEGELILN